MEKLISRENMTTLIGIIAIMFFAGVEPAVKPGDFD